MESDDTVKITTKQFEIWKKKCSVRSEKMRKKIFEDENVEEEIEAQEPVGAAFDYYDETHEGSKDNIFKRIIKYRLPTTIDPYADNVYLFYQFLVALSFIYNACSIPLRMSFPFQTDTNLKIWMGLDYMSDFFYLVDILVFQIRCQYIEGGIFMTERKDTKMHYVKSRTFKCDILSILPTDFIYIFVGYKPFMRINRLFKYESFTGFNSKFEMVLEQAYLFRVALTTCNLLYFIHLDACLYYYISYMQDFQTSWGYLQDGSTYIKCFFWAFLTTVTIGNVETPTSNFEYILQLSNFFLGLFIFSIVIGQVQNSVQAHSAEHMAYRRKKNDCVDYMQKNNIPENVQKKVRRWFEYTWETQKILDENSLLSKIPIKMHTEIAINVHIGVLSKVALFKECDRQLLHDLVLMLKPVLYLPGDFICKKGEIGREMYIISNGVVQVVGDSPSQVFATLRAGTAFGEISLLAVGGGNRRTANIYSPGFTTLFILFKTDLNEVLKNYPHAQAILRVKAKKMLQHDDKKVTHHGTTEGARFIATMVEAAKNRKNKLKNMTRVHEMHEAKQSRRRRGKPE